MADPQPPSEDQPEQESAVARLMRKRKTDDPAGSAGMASGGPDISAGDDGEGMTAAQRLLRARGPQTGKREMPKPREAAKPTRDPEADLLEAARRPVRMELAGGDESDRVNLTERVWQAVQEQQSPVTARKEDKPERETDDIAAAIARSLIAAKSGRKLERKDVEEFVQEAGKGGIGRKQGGGDSSSSS